MKRLFLAITFLLAACGSSDNHEDHRTYTTSNQQEVDDLKNQVLALQGTVNMINAFTANDFSSCKNTLPPFEQKVCQIAQTAVAEGQLDYLSALQEVSKLLQNQLFGVDCLNTTDVGCPVLGSVTSDLATAQASIASQAASIATITGQIATLQTNVTNIQNSVAAINTRLNSFNGTGNSIETVVTGINATLATLNGRVTAIETQIGTGQTWKTIKICGDISNSGPIYEAILLSGDRLQAVAYMQPGSSQHGLGILATANSSGNQYLTTALNSASCKFRLYDLTSQLKLCWKNTDKAATSAAIDTVCNFPSFASPTAACTCK